MPFDFKSNTVFEPFRIKMVEPMPVLNAAQRHTCMVRAHYNLFKLQADEVTFDFLTDSGTGAMSAEQWAGMMRGDESYAGSRSFAHFEQSVQSLTGLAHVIPTHQGRAAEFLLMKALLKPGQIVAGNTHFDTTRANIEVAQGVALDLPSPKIWALDNTQIFKGDLDIELLRRTLKERASSVALVIMTLTNNSVGGQPVSMANIQAVKTLIAPYGIPLFIDCARFAENCYFIKHHESGYAARSIASIAHEVFSYADGAMMSMKKDAFGNIGGFLAVKDANLAQELKNLMVVTEGFPTYGGLAGRDLEALAIGLKEILDEHYLHYRIHSTAYLGQGISAAGFKTVQPYGGHAIYIDAAQTLPHIPKDQFPGQSLSVALYQGLGIRSVEVGSVMLGKRDPLTGQEYPAPQELVRLAIPRRVYTQSHMDYIIEGLHAMHAYLPQFCPGYAFMEQSPVLRHFTAKFKPLI